MGKGLGAGFLLLFCSPAQQIDEARTCHREEICHVAWYTVVLGQVLFLGVKRNTSI